MIDLFLSNNKIAVFLKQKKNKKKIQITATREGQLLEAIIFQLLKVIIFSAFSQIGTFWLEIFCQHELENYFRR